MSEKMNKIWHYTKDNDYPVVFGKYENQAYPQIPCLVDIINGCCDILFWNVKECCWNDEYDDHSFNKDEVKRWIHLDDLTKMN